MLPEVDDFVDALFRYVANELYTKDATYSTEAVRIVDARNHLFETLPSSMTDESEDIYALSDLCMTTEETDIVPDRRRLYHVARNYWTF